MPDTLPRFSAGATIPLRKRGLRDALEGAVSSLAYAWRPVLLAFLLPCLLGIGAGLRSKPVYVAQARMLVLYAGDYVFHPGNHGTGNDIALDRNQIIQAELQILSSPALAKQTLAGIGPGTLYPGIEAGPDDPVRAASERFARDLVVTSIPQSNIVELTLRGGSRDAAIQTLGALIERYLPYRSTVFEKSQPVQGGAERAGFALRLQQAEDDLSRFGLEHGISNVDEQVNLLLRQRNDNANEQSQNAQQAAEAEARLATVTQQLRTVPPTVQAFAESARSQQATGLTDSLVKLTIQRRELLARYKDDFPLVRDVEQQIAAVRSQIAGAASREGAAVRTGRNGLYDELKVQEATLTAQVQGLQARRATLAGQAERIATRNDELVTVAQRYRELQRTRDVLDQSYRSIARSSEEAQLANAVERAAGANVRVVQPPDAPLSGTSQRALLMGGGVAAGLVAAAATLLLTSLTRRVALNEADVEQALGLPVLASVPSVQRGKGGAARLAAFADQDAAFGGNG